MSPQPQPRILNRPPRPQCRRDPRFRGSVYPKTVNGKSCWWAEIFINGKRINLGRFKTESDAIAAQEAYFVMFGPRRRKGA